MTLWRAFLWATLAALLMGGFLLAWLVMPHTWIIPVACGLLVVFMWVNVFVWCYWFTNK
jgi:hypothetical protein